MITNKKTSYEIPNTVKEIGNYCFHTISHMKTLTIGEKVETVNYGLYSLVNLTEYKVAEGNSNFIIEDGILYTPNKERLVRYPEAKDKNGYIVPYEIKQIGPYAFAFVSKLRSINLWKASPTIYEYAFRSISSVQRIVHFSLTHPPTSGSNFFYESNHQFENSLDGNWTGIDG